MSVIRRAPSTSDFDTDEEEEQFLLNLPDRNLFLGMVVEEDVEGGRVKTTGIPHSFMFFPSTKGLEGLVHLIQDRRGEALSWAEFITHPNWEEAYLDSYSIVVMNPRIVKDKGLQKMQESIPYDCVRIEFISDYVNKFRAGGEGKKMRSLPTPHKSKYRIGPSMCKHPVELDLIFLKLKTWRDVEPNRKPLNPMSVATFLSDTRARQQFTFDEESSSRDTSSGSESEKEEQQLVRARRLALNDGPPAAKKIRSEPSVIVIDPVEVEMMETSDTETGRGIKSKVPSTKKKNTPIAVPEAEDEGRSASSSEDNTASSERTKPPTPAATHNPRRQLSFVTERYAPPIDKRGRVIKGASSVNIDERTSKRAEAGESDSSTSSSDSVKTTLLNIPTNKNKRVLRVSPSKPSNLKNGKDSTSKPSTSSSKAVGTRTGYDSIQRSAARSKKRTPSPSPSDINLLISSDEESSNDKDNNDDDDSDDVEEKESLSSSKNPSVSKYEYFKSQSIPKKPSVAISKPSESRGKRVFPKHTYTPGDDQLIVDFILTNRWGKYTKGNELWKFLVNKDLLRRTNLRDVTDQSLSSRWKKEIRPKLEDYIMRPKRVPPYIIAGEDWGRYTRDVNISSMYRHGTVTRFPKDDYNTQTKIDALNRPPFR